MRGLSEGKIKRAQLHRLPQGACRCATLPGAREHVPLQPAAPGTGLPLPASLQPQRSGQPRGRRAQLSTQSFDPTSQVPQSAPGQSPRHLLRPHVFPIPSLPTLGNYTLPLPLASLSWGRAEAGEEGDRKGVGT